MLELKIRILITKHLVLVKIRMYTGESEKRRVSNACILVDAANWLWLPIGGCGFNSSMVGPGSRPWRGKNGDWEGAH